MIPALKRRRSVRTGNEDDFDAESPWPRVGPPLLGPDADWWNNAVLNPETSSWWLYANGYARGAAVLVQYVTEGNRDQDFLVYPIAFLYRHHVELALKDLIHEASAFLDKPHPDTSREHRLDVLWARLKPLLMGVWPNGDAETLAAVELRVGELATVDGGSFSFRYPETNSGKPSLPPDLTKVNIRRFGDVMRELVAFFDACELGISVYERGEEGV